MNAPARSQARGIRAAARRWAAVVARLLRSGPPVATGNARERLACGKAALSVAQGMKAATLGAERVELLLLGLVNTRFAVLCLTAARERPASVPAATAGQPPELYLARFAAQNAEGELGADVGQLRGELEQSLREAEALLAELEEPARRARAAQRRLWAVALAPPLVLALVVGLAAWRVFGAREVSIGKPWATSSTGLVCDPEHQTCGGWPTRIFFHTKEDAEPWFEIDLGQEYELSRIEVQNRSDCCAERALPVIVEVSRDHLRYRAVARKFAVFDLWKQSLPSIRARFVRLRVTRQSTLHLERVRVYGRRLG